jgi:hypothetical protein
LATFAGNDLLGRTQSLEDVPNGRLVRTTGLRQRRVDVTTNLADKFGSAISRKRLRRSFQPSQVIANE